MYTEFTKQFGEQLWFVWEMTSNTLHDVNAFVFDTPLTVFRLAGRTSTVVLSSSSTKTAGFW